MNLKACQAASSTWGSKLSFIAHILGRQGVGLVEKCGKHKNHQSTAALLAVLWYSDLLGDMDDEDECECGWELVTRVAGWQTEMAKWIGEQQEVDDLDEDLENAGSGFGEPTAMPSGEIMPCKLSVLFGGEVAPPLRQELVLDEEAALMEALADQEEDEYPDDSEMEGSGDDYK
jgi:hypothetical protein